MSVSRIRMYPAKSLLVNSCAPWINPHLKVLFWEIVDRIIQIFTARSKLVLPSWQSVLMFRAGDIIWDTCQYMRDESLSKSGSRLSIDYLDGFFYIIFWKLNTVKINWDSPPPLPWILKFLLIRVEAVLDDNFWW